jgi:hypothetical protein
MLQRMAAVLLSLLLLPTSSFAAVGSVEKATGPAELFRSKEKLDVKRDTGIEMNDDIRTGNGIIGIGFDDKTKVQIEKHSKLIIDDFVYDASNPTTSKLGLKVALGTVKYASGLIAKNNRQAVAISTPTARIGVLGTAFSMTVDEIGKSLIILLPNADGSVGEISVESDVGQVILNQAYQATVVGASENNPTPPVILDLTDAQINNLLIIKKPKEKDEEEISEANILDFNELDINKLDENELDKDELVFGRLDFSLLDVDLLANILDALNRRVFANVEAFPTNPIKPGSYEEGNTQIFKEGEWYIFRNFDNRIVEITVGENSQTQMQLNQAGSNVTLYTQENASDSLIIINQN